MMNTNINIKASVNHINLSGIFEILRKYQLEKKEDGAIIEHNGFNFYITSESDTSINYTITELCNITDSL